MLPSRSCTRIARAQVAPLASKVHPIASGSRPVVLPVQRRGLSTPASSSSLPPAWNPRPPSSQLAPYPSQDKVQVIVDSEFFTVDSLNPTILTKSLREFGHQYGRSVVVKMFRQPHHAHAIDLVNAGIEIRLFGSLVANKDNLPNQMLISDLWTFAMDNPDGTTIIFTKDRTYAIPLNTLSNRGHKIVVVSEFALHDTEMAAAGVFVDVADFLARWPVHAPRLPMPPKKVVSATNAGALSSTKAASKPAFASKLAGFGSAQSRSTPAGPVKVVARKVVVPRRRVAASTPTELEASLAHSGSGVVNPSAESIETFCHLADCLQALAELSHSLQQPARPLKMPIRLLSVALQSLHLDVVRRSGFPSPSVMAHNLGANYPEKITLPPRLKDLPKKARKVEDVILRTLEAFGGLPRVDRSLIVYLRAFYFSELTTEFTEIELEKAIAQLETDGKVIRGPGGDYTLPVSPGSIKSTPAASSSPKDVATSLTPSPTLIEPPFPFPTSHRTSSAPTSKEPAASKIDTSSPSAPLSSFFADNIAPTKPDSKATPRPTSPTSIAAPATANSTSTADLKATPTASTPSVPSMNDPEYLSLQLNGLQSYLDSVDAEQPDKAKPSNSTSSAPSTSSSTPSKSKLAKPSSTQASRPGSDAAQTSPSTSSPLKSNLYRDLSGFPSPPSATSPFTSTPKPAPATTSPAPAPQASSSFVADESSASSASTITRESVSAYAPRKLVPAESSITKKKGKLVWN